MNTYRARFTAQAEVTFEILVTAENQNDGIVAAHDMAGTAAPEQAKVTNIVMETLQIQGFEKLERFSSELPPGPLDTAAEFTVQAFSGKDCFGEKLFAVSARSFGAAKDILAGALSPAQSNVGSAQIMDSLGQMVQRTNAERGGWEVEVYAPTQTSVKDRFTWLPSAGDAMTLVASQLATQPSARIHILDYTDRITGPKLWKAIG